MGKYKEGNGKDYRKDRMIISVYKKLSFCLPIDIKNKFKGKAENEFRAILEKYQISEEEFYSGCLLFSLILSTMVFLCTFIYTSSYTVPIITSITIFIISSGFPNLLISEKAKQLRNAYVSYADIILKAFLFSKMTTGNIYDGVIALNNLGEEVPHGFKATVKKTLLEGWTVEHALMNYTNEAPLKNFEEYILTLLRSDNLQINWQQAAREARRKVREEYQRYTLELESRLTIFVGLTMFLPLILTTWLIMPNTENITYLIPLIQVSSALILSKFLLSSTGKIL